MLELLGRTLFCDLRGGRERDVSPVSARAVVAGGQSELQLVSGQLARWSRKWVANKLHLQRRVRGPERRPVFGKNELDLLGMSRRYILRGRCVFGMHG